MRPRGTVFVLLMAIAVGVVAGVGAWGFRMLIGADSGADSSGPGGRALRYKVLPEQATLLSAVRAVFEEGAELIVVSRRPDSRRTEDVVGVVAAAVLARTVATENEIS